LFFTHKHAEEARIAALSDAERRDAESKLFEVPTSISSTKEWFYEDLAKAIGRMQTDEKIEKLSKKAFRDIWKCYDHDFQVNAVEIVARDTTGRYFKSTIADGSLPEDVAIDRFRSQRIAFDAIERHEQIPTYEDFNHAPDENFFVKSDVQPLDGIYPGRVESWKMKRGKNLQPDERVMFTVKYYKEVIGEGRAKKVLECTKAELLPIFVVREENNDNEDIAAHRNEMRMLEMPTGVSKMTRMKIMVTKNSMEMQSNKK